MKPFPQAQVYLDLEYYDITFTKCHHLGNDDDFEDSRFYSKYIE